MEDMTLMFESTDRQLEAVVQANPHSRGAYRLSDFTELSA